MEFYIIKNGKQEGPYTIDQLATMGITPETNVWAEGMDDWRQAGEVPELTTILQKQEFNAHQQQQQPAAEPPKWTPAAQPQPQQAAAAATATQAPVVTGERKRNNRGLLWTLIVLVVLATLVFTCPDKEDHRKAIYNVTKLWLDQKVDDKGLGGFMNDIIKMVSGRGADMAIDEYLDVDNYIVCSVGRIELIDKTQRVSFGILGHVFTFDKQDIEDAIQHVIDSHNAQGSNNGSNLGIAPPVNDPETGEPTEPDPDNNYATAPDTTGYHASTPEEELLDTILSSGRDLVGQAIKEWVNKRLNDLIQ